MSDVVTHRGDVFKTIAQPAQFTAGLSRHHRRSYSNYDIAKAHIAQAIGDITDMELFGRQVLVAVFCKPNMREVKRADGSIAQIHTPVKAIMEDWWQGKACLILKCGPEAFAGDDSYVKAMFGDADPPKPGDWVFAHSNAGTQMMLADDGTASRPQALDFGGEPMDLFEWDGWPCRIVGDDQFYGRVSNPQSIV